MIAEIFALLVVIFFLLQYILRIQVHKNFPPGPSGLPILGYIPFVRFPLHVHFGKLHKIYGKIMGLALGSYRVVFVSDSKMLRKLFNDDRLTGRPSYPAMEDALYDGKFKGLAMAHGKAYTEQRKFAIQNLKEFGFGKSLIEDNVLEEVRDLILEFKKHLNEPFHMTPKIQVAVVNSIWRTVAGERYAHNDPRVLELVSILAKAHEVPYLVPLMFPNFAVAYPKLTGFQIAIDAYNEMYKFHQRSIDSHKKDLDPSSPRDLIDVYLTRIQSCTDSDSSFYAEKGEAELRVLLTDFFTAGMDPPVHAVDYAMLYLAINPRAQDKLYAEILNVVGDRTSRSPVLADRRNMPYTQAVITEVLRMSTIAPFGVPHMALETFEFEGYTIPKNTLVAANFWQMSYDVEYWGDPETFRPERFLMEDGEYKGDEAVCPFSVGKRVCVGETLARNEIFLFVTGLIQHLQFSVDKNNPQVLLSYENGITRAPKPFNVIISERN